jgi:hypothetical protein
VGKSSPTTLGMRDASLWGMKKWFLVIGALAVVIIGLNKEHRPGPGECKDGMCWVKDLQDGGETILVNNYVVKNCRFIDKATVACPHQAQ